MSAELLALVDKVTLAGVGYAWGRSNADCYRASHNPADQTQANFADILDERDAVATQQFADAVTALREAIQGLKLEGDEEVAQRRTIRTLEELEALPKNSVVLEDQYEAAYQKDADGPDGYWSGDGRWYGSVQIDLPVTVIYEGVRK